MDSVIDVYFIVCIVKAIYVSLSETLVELVLVDYAWGDAQPWVSEQTGCPGTPLGSALASRISQVACRGVMWCRHGWFNMIILHWFSCVRVTTRHEKSSSVVSGDGFPWSDTGGVWSSPSRFAQTGVTLKSCTARNWPETPHFIVNHHLTYKMNPLKIELGF